MIIYSHKFDLIVKLIMGALLISIANIFDFRHLEQQLISDYNLKTSQGQFITTLGIIAELVLLWFVLYLPYLSPLASSLYMRFTLKTPVSWAMAKQLSPFLSPSLRTMQWYPMLFIKDLPEEERMEALMELINHLKNNNHARPYLFSIKNKDFQYSIKVSKID